MQFAHEHLFMAVLTFIALVAGAFLHTWVVASNTVNSRLNGITGYEQYIKLFVPSIMFRFAVSWVIFLIYAENSAGICQMLSENFSSLAWLAKHPIHPSPVIGLAYGLFMDSLLNPVVTFFGKWVPGLNINIPPPPGMLGVDKP